MIKMFSVFVLNLRFGLADDGPNAWPIRKEIFPDLLKQYSSDFFCFQEANDFQIDFLQSLLPEHRYIGKRSPAPSFWQNNVIFYHEKWNCVHDEHLFLSLTPKIPSRYHNSKWPRQCTIGLFQQNGHRLICANTHFDFAPQVQDQSANLILTRLSEMGPNLPTIVTGDFNADPSSSCYALFTQAMPKAKNPTAGFNNSFEAPFPGTHHGFTGSLKGDYIDWILYRGDMEKKEASVITGDFNGIFPSDHFPLTATFSWLVS